MALAVPPGGTPPPTELRPEAATPHAQTISRSDAPRRRAAPPVPAVSVVIVNFCQWRNTARLVTQLRRSAAVRSGTAEVVVVDNHSPSHPVARKLEKMRGVKVRRFSRNVGFARAVNRGVADSGPVARGTTRRPDPVAPGAGEWVLLLNPDVTVDDGFLDDLTATISKLTATDPGVGVVGFRLRNRDGTDQASSGPFPTLGRTLAGLFLPRSRRKCTHRPEPVRQAVDWVTGGCLLVRRDCFAQLGGLDETYFLYYEDVDFCRRATAAGWRVWFDPALEATHHWPLHARRVPAPLRLMTRHALLTYAQKHWAGWRARVMSGVVWSEAALRQAWAAARGDWDASRCYGQLRKLVGDVTAGRDREARRRIRYAAAFLNPIAAEQDGRTQ
ncbi:Putative glycosyltransferase OS=Singulisphaera acidiphila (strain ATCC BAA-1392 / DSM 18658 / VKM B-2454 / MOB10) GN=Sinac_5389 PE=4 SV=1: Glyco_tranf_2_3 [Gemmataceae bacterium]|nr:Putative glycosyltransferase OS=Singulisphaera acidiphila (strain ATCC BAA-1392 / DSM 18658 / VKM B-2454 / MOB10) GN=Sinac_5389 PE=4 SV=1: Glyco_tranf_2_3 [Gemmataceae bacterium]VTT97854.1 Putative glycosyltransferase OS=Singulisphaera acidiphila (strain ATCC BAA-1392 / DSM 18658 / VKM B-2454 / MOB10) GN=Sinac_5389 PE=4 SV=1: Glyco_tranf_2_3 [Gemmataceae bacterium]